MTANTTPGNAGYVDPNTGSWVNVVNASATDRGPWGDGASEEGASFFGGGFGGGLPEGDVQYAGPGAGAAPLAPGYQAGDEYTIAAGYNAGARYKIINGVPVRQPDIVQMEPIEVIGRRAPTGPLRASGAESPLSAATAAYLQDTLGGSFAGDPYSAYAGSASAQHALNAATANLLDNAPDVGPEFASSNPTPNQSASIRPLGAVEGFFSLNPVGRGLKGAGGAAFDTWTTLPRALAGLTTLVGDAYGYAREAIAPQRSVLTGQPFGYQPNSALLQSLQQNGAAGTLGLGITGAVRNAPGIGLIGALASPSRDWANVGAQTFNTGLGGVGMAAGLRSMSTNNTSLGLQTLDPTRTSFTQSWVSFQKAGADYNLDSLVQSMIKDGWKGKPVDVVRMPDGTIASIDNTRILAARKAGIEYQGNVRGFDELITDRKRQSSLTENGVVPKTWGEAAQLRINKATQSGMFRNGGIQNWSQRFPYGSIYDPAVR